MKENEDLLAGFAVFGGVDVFSAFPSQQMVARQSDSATEKSKRVLLSQVFHGKQAMTQSKTDLLQAKRESRALRRAKYTHIKKGQFVDAFCTKAIERTELRLIQDLI